MEELVDEVDVVDVDLEGGDGVVDVVVEGGLLFYVKVDDEVVEVVVVGVFDVGDLVVDFGRVCGDGGFDIVLVGDVDIVDVVVFVVLVCNGDCCIVRVLVY